MGVRFSRISTSPGQGASVMNQDQGGVKRPTIKPLNMPSGPAPAIEWQEPQNQSQTQATPPAKERGGIDRDILMAGAGCVLILFAGLLIAGVFALRVVNNRQSPEPPTVPAVAAMPTATETPVPTRTPTPTPVSPYTPLPTWTPIGNKPQIYDYRGSDKEYRDDVNGLGDFMKQSVVDVNDLLAKPDPTNQNWAYKLLAQTTVWQDYFSETTAIIPPDRYQDFHENLKKALSHLKIAADDVNYALEFEEPDRLDQAKSEIATGAKMLDDALASLRSSA